MHSSVPSASPVRPALADADVLALIADSVICTDDDGRIMVFNRAAERTFGYSASEVMGQHVELLLPERYRAEHAQQVRNFASGEGETGRIMGHSREVWGRRKDGEEFPAEATVARQIVDGSRLSFEILVNERCSKSSAKPSRASWTIGLGTSFPWSTQLSGSLPGTSQPSRNSKSRCLAASARWPGHNLLSNPGPSRAQA